MAFLCYPTAKSFGKNSNTNWCIFRPEGRLPDLVAYVLLGGQMNVVTLHAFGNVADAIFKQALLHAKASETNIPQYVTLSVSNNPLWRYLKKVLKEKAPLYLGFQIQSRTWCSTSYCLPRVFFLFLCVVDYGLGSLSRMLRHIATCTATWGRPIACPKLRAYLAIYLCTVQFWYSETWMIFKECE